MVRIQFQIFKIHILCTLIVVPDTCWVGIAHCDMDPCWIILFGETYVRGYAFMPFLYLLIQLHVWRLEWNKSEMNDWDYELHRSTPNLLLKCHFYFYTKQFNQINASPCFAWRHWSSFDSLTLRVINMHAGIYHVYLRSIIWANNIIKRNVYP